VPSAVEVSLPGTTIDNASINREQLAIIVIVDCLLIIVDCLLIIVYCRLLIDY
jgi:hypothetical protein